ncbi:hypothetical protein PR202_ga25708 [Eleusine coracana subsp. coracana]|uniref:Uncharacterized protein n=1 Tax=Eleusine coracana subsp. coracana TaxID=191504 RepID=A0AAV5DC11_ELECO|nr:hypothetical protein PR202_ga25708 [Eleusine coracana subsp. coracana]
MRRYQRLLTRAARTRSSGSSGGEAEEDLSDEIIHQRGRRHGAWLPCPGSGARAWGGWEAAPKRVADAAPIAWFGSTRSSESGVCA